MRIILGTASKQRRQVFEEMGYKDFEILTADIDEKAIRLDNPQELTIALAKAKATALTKRIEEPAILITADQVISWNGTIREKPENEKEAREFLRTYYLAPAMIVNGVVVTNTATGKQVLGNDSTKVIFAEIPKDAINRILAESSVLEWAGGFAIENPLFKPYIEDIEGVAGSSRGLPEALTKKLIEEVS
ncbi:MAG: Maf family protein [Candidatus Colwellbacteria bacterium]|nr:Maf family protein [Candidatus Colwellbacteria bacterium]